MVAKRQEQRPETRALLLLKVLIPYGGTEKSPLWGLEFHYVLCRWTFLAVDDFKSHALTFAEGFETFG